MNEHRSRFKAYLVPVAALKAEAQNLAPYLQEFRAQYLAGTITAAEWATLFVFLYLNQRHPHTPWWMKKQNPWAGEKNYFLAHWLKNYQFKKLPDSIARALYYWQQGEYKIIFKDKMISPYEMLQYQARGERVVTLAYQEAEEGLLVDGARDALEFLLHDLVHADLFFETKEKWQEQKSFFQSVLTLVDQGQLIEEQKNPQFQQDFHYLISDMNSHPAHLAAMLKASYIKHLLVHEGKTTNQELSEVAQTHLSKQLTHWQKLGAFDVALHS